MFTSRAEFRLHLRIDNADRRLTPHGRRVGLITDEAWVHLQAKPERLQGMRQLLEKTKLTSAMLDVAARVGTAAPSTGSGQAPGCPSEQSSEDAETEHSGVTSTALARSIDLSAVIGQTCAQLLKRPEITIEQLAPVLSQLAPDFFLRETYPVPALSEAEGPSVPAVVKLSSEVRNELKSVETEIKYEGYLRQQERAIDRLKKAEQRSIPDWFDYRSVSGLSREMQETLTKIQPRTLGHATRIPGVTPAAVSLVNVYIEIQAQRREQAAAIKDSRSDKCAVRRLLMK